MYGLSFIDRLILSLLAPAITEGLQISDTQIGLLFGLGFGVIYALMGLPLAHLIDQYRRIPLVAAGVAIWSLCTVASAFAPNFTWMVILRSGIAIGEAVLSPAVISLIADMFPREKRMRPITIYTAVGTIMYTDALVLGGAALQLGTLMSTSVALQPWQLTLVLVGLPGLILAPLLLITVPEPPRIGDARSEKLATIAEAVGYFRKEQSLYLWLFVGVSAISMCNSAKIAWTPTLLIRAHGMDAAHAGYAFGAAGLISSFLGALT